MSAYSFDVVKRNQGIRRVKLDFASKHKGVQVSLEAGAGCDRCIKAMISRGY